MSEWAKKEDLAILMDLREKSKVQELGGVVGIMQKLHTTLDGLSGTQSDIDARKERYGKNEMLKPAVKSFLRIWLESFNDLTLIILIVLAIVSLIIAFAVEHGKDLSWLDGTAILITVIVVTLVSSINTWSQERQFQKLNDRQKDRQILVIRKGQPTKISIFDLVVGDVLTVLTGDVLPADGVIVLSSELTCDEAPMTGESELIKKTPEDNCFLLCGCKVQTGNGKMLVVAVGMDTQFGVLKKAVITAAAEKTETPLQKKLDGLAKFIGYIGFSAAGLVLLLLLVFWIVPLAQDKSVWENGKYLKELIDYFIIAVTIIVMAVPEGLPLAVTISLAYSMRKMLADNNLVRRLASCETMGGATTICSDKTGTLTMNKMKVTAGFYHDRFHLSFPTFTAAVPGASREKAVGDAGDGIYVAVLPATPLAEYPPAYVQLLAEAIALNSTGDIRLTENPSATPGSYDYLGNVTECAMLLFLMEQGIDYRVIRTKYEKLMVQSYPFSSEKKRMTNIYRNEAGQYTQYTKGASEIVTRLCTSFLAGGDGLSAQPITAEKRAEIDGHISTLASNGLRTIAVAFRSLEPPPAETAHLPSPYGEKANEDDLTLIGIVGIKDPLRPEVPPAIVDCHTAHIVVRMVTGDNIDTAMNISKECGIYDPKEGIAMEGLVFRTLPNEERLRILPRLQVLARSSPIDKQILVAGLQALKHVVAVTGDGTNDAPALSKADVGFAMGITGTEVSKDAAAIILTDDNFASIVKAAMWGRNVYDCIRKFLQFQLTVNFSAIVIACVGAVFAITPLKAVPMLWVNLIMDTLAALALATEMPTPKLLKRSPCGRDDPIICRSMWRNILGGAVYEVIIVMLELFLWGAEVKGVEAGNSIYPGCFDNTNRAHFASVSRVIFKNGLCRHFLLDSQITLWSNGHFSLIFNTFIWVQMFNLIASRKCYNELNFFEHMLENTMFWVIWLIIAALQVIVMFVPGMRDVFSIEVITYPSAARLFGYAVAFGFGILPFKFLIHLCLPMKDPFAGTPPIPPDKGVPAGVYRAGAPPPAGCELESLRDLQATATHLTESAPEPVPEPYVKKVFNVAKVGLKWKNYNLTKNSKQIEENFIHKKPPSSMAATAAAAMAFSKSKSKAPAPAPAPAKGKPVKAAAAPGRKSPGPGPRPSSSSSTVEPVPEPEPLE